MNSIRHNSVTSLSTASSYPLYMTTTPRPHCTALPGLTLTRDQIATHPRPQPGTGHADTALDTWCGHADMLRVNTPQLDTSLDGRNCQHQPPSCYKPIDKLDISTGWTKKKWDLKNNGHNSAEIHQKGKKLVCFGKFCINAAG